MPGASRCPVPLVPALELDNQRRPDARWAPTWVRSRLKGIAAGPRSSGVIYTITWGWSHSGEGGWEAAPWSVDFDVDLLNRMDMACA
jgi:hypothetical protein